MTGEELRAYRESRGLSAQDMVTKLNERLERKYDRARLSRWETGAEPIPKLVETALKNATPLPHRSGRAVVVALANQKGGVAKTTSAINTTYVLAKQGMRVLLVDCDPQGSATLHLGIAPGEREEEERTLAHMLVKELPTMEAVVSVCDGLFDLIPSSIYLAEVEASLATDPLAGLALQSKMEEVADRYDVIVLDCPPNLGFVSVSALVAADALIVPSQTEMLSVMGIPALLKTMERVRRRAKTRCKVLGILPTLFNARRMVDQEMLRRLQSFAQESGLALYPPVKDASDYGKAAATMRPTLEMSPNAPGADSYHAVAASILAFVKAQETAHGA